MHPTDANGTKMQLLASFWILRLSLKVEYPEKAEVQPLRFVGDLLPGMNSSRLQT